MKLLPGLALAVLLCAAVDSNLTRADYAHRVQDWLLPAQTLLLWAAWGVLLALPVRWTGGRSGAGLATALGWLGGTVLLHHVLDVRRGGEGGLSLRHDGLVVGGALLALVAATWLLGRLERTLARGRAHGPGRWLTLALLLLGVASLIPRGGQPEPQHVSRARAEPERAARPNILLLVWDTTRADHLSPWGYERETTPHLARLAEQSRVYETCWSSSVFTLSSHVSMLTGLPPALHGTTMRHQQVTAQTVAPLLARAGYRTGAFVGTAVLTGEGGLRHGFDVYDDLVDPPVCDTALWSLVNNAQVIAAKLCPALRFNGQPHWIQDFQRPAREVLADAAAWIRDGGPEPWFAVINLFDVHWPYEPSAEALSRWARPYSGPLTGHLFRADDWPPGRKADASDKLHARDLYDAEVWDLDRAVGDFLAGLDLARGSTEIIVSADHGEALGENDEWSHEHPRVPQARVPLLIFAPGRVPAGSRVSAPVSGMDIAPTLLEMAGIEPPPGFAALGRSLLPPQLPDDRLLFVQDHDNEFSSKDEDAAVRGRFKLLRAPGRGSQPGAPSDSLHDTLTDPMDETDIASQHAELARELSAALDELRQVAPATGTAVIDEDVLRSLGYVGH